MMRRLLGVVAVVAVFLSGATFGPALVPQASAQQGAQTVIIADLLGGAAEGGATVELLYDDTNMRATGVRVTNNLPGAIYVEVLRDGDNLLYSQRFPPLNTTVINIPTTPAGRINLFLDARGNMRGYHAGVTYPVP